MPFQFLDEVHQARFLQGRILSGRGGVGSAHCGARTRLGGTCRQPPLRGHSRCLRHAGPKAANERHRQLLRAFARGQVSIDEMLRVERRRAVNRLREKWKRAPWTPGSTIDLGEYEAAFQIEIARPLDRGMAIAPAVLDWLRWRYRRLKIDRSDDFRWAETLRRDYQYRRASAGPAPTDYQAEMTRSADYTWVVPGGSGSLRRQGKDRPRVALVPRRKRKIVTMGQLGGDQEEFAMLYLDNREILAPIFSRCANDDERRGVLVALHRVIAQPHSEAARGTWLKVLRATGVN
jgi:hypothetical protein